MALLWNAGGLDWFRRPPESNRSWMHGVDASKDALSRCLRHSCTASDKTSIVLLTADSSSGCVSEKNISQWIAALTRHNPPVSSIATL